MAITFPSVLSHHAAEVFPDTADIDLYYLVPTSPLCVSNMACRSSFVVLDWRSREC